MLPRDIRTKSSSLPEQVKAFIGAIEHSIKLSIGIQSNYPSLLTEMEEFRNSCSNLTASLVRKHSGKQDMAKAVKEIDAAMDQVKDQMVKVCSSSFKSCPTKDLTSDIEIDCSLPSMQQLFNCKNGNEEKSGSITEEMDIGGLPRRVETIRNWTESQNPHPSLDDSVQEIPASPKQ
uniref:Uncharacterized protein n=1 Tax=Ciona savignyi TaxID=51511 RepID=H2YZY4_CIOSA